MHSGPLNAATLARGHSYHDAAISENEFCLIIFHTSPRRGHPSTNNETSFPILPGWPYERGTTVHVYWYKRMLIPSCSAKGLFINYGEGGGATKWENRGSETFCAPPPSRQGKTFRAPPPLLKNGNFTHTPYKWLKLQATA